MVFLDAMYLALILIQMDGREYETNETIETLSYLLNGILLFVFLYILTIQRVRV